MKNKISDLRDHMFAALERLGQEDLSEDDLKKEISRSQAISEVGKVIVESAKTEVLFAKLTGKRDQIPREYLETEDEPKKIERPKAEYSNKTPYGIAKSA
jgi:hypothetical protein